MGLYLKFIYAKIKCHPTESSAWNDRPPLLPQLLVSATEDIAEPSYSAPRPLLLAQIHLKSKAR